MLTQTLRGRLATLRVLECAPASSRQNSTSVSQLSERVKDLDPEKLDPNLLDSLTFVLSLREQSYQSVATLGTAETIAGLKKTLSHLNDAQKDLLVQKVVAASGAQAVPVLLAWSAATVQQRAAEVIKNAKAERLADIPFMGYLISKASHAMQSSMHAAKPGAEAELVADFLKQPNALTWDDLLSLPYLEHLLQAAVAGDPTLQHVLEQLGMAHLPAASPSPSAAAQLECMALEARQRLAAAASTSAAAPDLPARVSQAAAQAADDKKAAILADAVSARIASFCTSQLGFAAAPHVHTTCRVLGCVRPVSAPAAASGSSKPGSDAAASSTGSGASQGSGVAVDLDMSLVKSAASQLATSKYAQTAGIGGVLKSSDADVVSTLSKLAADQPGGPAEKLLQAIQQLRVKLMLAGDVPTLITTTAADVAALSVEQFWAVYRAARRAEAAGTALAKALLAPEPGTAPLGLEALSALPASDRSALAWVLCRGSSAASSSAVHPTGPAAAAALLQAFRQRAVGAAATAATAARAGQDLAAALKLEADLAEAALLGSSRHAPGVDASSSDSGSQQQPPQLPDPAALESAQRATSAVDPSLLLLDALVTGAAASDSWAAAHQADAGTGSAEGAARVVYQSLIGASGPTGAALLGAGSDELPESLVAWAESAKKELLALSPLGLASLATFCELRLSNWSSRQAAPGSSKLASGQDRARLRALLLAVQEAAGRAQQAQAGGGAAAPMSPYWRNASMPSASADVEAAAEAASQAVGLPSPRAVRALLGDGPEAREYEGWLRASVLLAEGERIEAMLAEEEQPYELLAEYHRSQDTDRFLTMEHDPQLHLSFTEAPRPWSEAGAPLHVDSEAAFLEGMRPWLDRYLASRGMRGVLDGEWPVYAGRALAEFGRTRAEHEAALHAHGRSAMFNSKAEAAYLSSLLEAGVPPDAPLGPQARRYLGVLETNPSWTFAQKKRAVQRLIELSVYFAKLPQGGHLGSPFSALFAAKDPAPLAPRYAR